jgi:hypothetical protein
LKVIKVIKMMNFSEDEKGVIFAGRELLPVITGTTTPIRGHPVPGPAVG